MFSYISGNIQFISHSSQSYSGKDNTAENLLMMLFTWVRDLSQELQEQILSSIRMQQVLKLLQHKVYLDKFISNQSVEEQFKTEYQNYYGQQDYVNGLMEYAQISHNNCSAFIDAPAEITSSIDEILIDPSQKYAISFGMPISL